MSADRDFVDDRAPDGHDPYDIVPDGFVDAYDATSIPEALRKAEQAPSRTPTDEMRRCPNPECHSVRIRIKPGDPDRAQRRAGDYTCAECSTHFDTPAPSREACRDHEQATLDEVSPDGDD